jgi:hypothetical protein
MLYVVIVLSFGKFLPNFGILHKEKSGNPDESDVVIFSDHSVYFMAIWYFCGLWVYFSQCWYICTRKNLATLLEA